MAPEGEGDTEEEEDTDEEDHLHQKKFPTRGRYIKIRRKPENTNPEAQFIPHNKWTYAKVLFRGKPDKYK